MKWAKKKAAKIAAFFIFEFDYCCVNYTSKYNMNS